MVTTIDMQHMRYLNLFEKVTRVNTKYCFNYNEGLVFIVPRRLVSKAIGEDAKNLKRINQIIHKRIKVVAQPVSIKDVKSFIETVVSPVTFNDIEVKEDEVILSAGSRNKAALLGRNKRRLLEMQKIIKAIFGKEFKII